LTLLKYEIQKMESDMPNLTKSALIRNQILAALPRAEYERLMPVLEQKRLAKGDILYDVGDAVRSAYFIESGVVSTREGETIAVGMVGSEGMVGIPGLLRRSKAPLQAVVQIPGEALAVGGDVLRREFKRGGELQDLVLCFTHTLVTQIAQAVLCNHFHTIEERLSRWLLATRDRTEEDTFLLTHEELSHMLGTPRTGVTKAAGALQDAGLIRYKRGKIMVLDRKGLERAACECYRVIREETESFIAA
jgi:CRP-like cAMP-binding protein